MSIERDELVMSLFHARPESADELWYWLQVFMGVKVPRKKIYSRSNAAPFDYLWWSWKNAVAAVEGKGEYERDCIVHAARGSGKTYVGAILSVLEGHFFPKYSVRILGGCLRGDSRVLTVDQGGKPIAEFKLGEKIICDGEQREVIGMFKRHYRGKTYWIRASGVRLTPEHLVMTEDGWLPIEEVVGRGHDVGMYFSCGDREIDADLMWLFGFLMSRMRSSFFDFNPGVIAPELVAVRQIGYFTEAHRGEVYDRFNRIGRRWNYRTTIQRYIGKFSRTVRKCGGKESATFVIMEVSEGVKRALEREIGMKVPSPYEQDAGAQVLSFLKQLRPSCIAEFLKGYIAGGFRVQTRLYHDARRKQTWRSAQVYLSCRAPMMPVISIVLSMCGIGFYERQVSGKHPIAIPHPEKIIGNLNGLSARSGFIPHLGLGWKEEFRFKQEEWDGDVYDISVSGGDNFLCPGVQIHNSLSQSEKMYLYISAFLQRRPFSSEVASIDRTRAVFKNGSIIEILPHSVKRVHGEHVDKFRCDELDDFKPQVWRALQFSARSIEKLSTQAKPKGIMSEELNKSEQKGDRLFRWSVFEVARKCPRKSCVLGKRSRCPIHQFCNGMLRRKSDDDGGFILTPDIIRYYKRNPAAFEAEMLNHPMPTEGAIFLHFRAGPPFVVSPYFLKLAPTWRALDFGQRDPSVCLWIQEDKERERYIVIDHLTVRGVPPSRFGEMIVQREKKRKYLNIIATWADPSGAGYRAELQEQFGFIFSPSRPPKIKRVQAISSLLTLREDGTPALQICSNVEPLIEELLAYDMNKFTRGVDDDHVEALGYWAVNVHRMMSFKKIVVPANSAYRRRRPVISDEYKEAIVRRVFPTNPRPFSGSEF